MKDPIPVYVIAGFLDSGKSTFINNTLDQGFARDYVTLLLRCEEGEEDYHWNRLGATAVVNVDAPEDLTTQNLLKWDRLHRPEQVLVELNGMWSLPDFAAALPDHWVLNQVITIVEAATFDMYAKNMGQLMMEKISAADLLVFNRCTPELAQSLRARNLRMVNRRGEIYLEMTDGKSESYSTGDECPFDLTPEVVDIPDNDYGVWYVDVMDHLDRWVGKKVHLKMLMFRSKKWNNAACPGRFAMVCCENDITYLAMLGKGAPLDSFKDRQWMEVTAQVGKVRHPAYQGEDGPVLDVLTATGSTAPEPEVISF